MAYLMKLKRLKTHEAAEAINEKYALRVVYEKREGYLVVITFFPVRRERYGI